MDTFAIISVLMVGFLFYVVGILIEIFASNAEDTTLGNDKRLPALQVLGALIFMFAGIFFAADGENVTLGGFVGVLGALLLTVSGLKIIKSMMIR